MLYLLDFPTNTTKLKYSNRNANVNFVVQKIPPNVNGEADI